MFSFKLCSLTLPKVDADMDVREVMNQPSRSGSPDQDGLGHVTVGNPDPPSDPGTAHGDQTCQFTWTDETSPTLILSWSCTRELGHQGQHHASTGEWVAAVHPQLRPTAPPPHPPASSTDQ